MSTDAMPVPTVRYQTEDECEVCTRLREFGPDDFIYADERWFAYATPKYPWMINFGTRRHNAGIWDLDEQETAELGPITVKLTSAMIDMWTDRVYFVCFNEGTNHFHAGLLTRCVEVSEKSHGAMYARTETDIESAPAAREKAQELKAYLREQSTAS